MFGVWANKKMVHSSQTLLRADLVFCSPFLNDECRLLPPAGRENQFFHGFVIYWCVWYTITVWVQSWKCCEMCQPLLKGIQSFAFKLSSQLLIHLWTCPRIVCYWSNQRPHKSDSLVGSCTLSLIYSLLITCIRQTQAGRYQSNCLPLLRPGILPQHPGLILWTSLWQ